MRTKVHGCSDDYVRVETDGGADSVSAYKPTFLLFSDGTQARWEYNEQGEWRCDVVSRGTAEATVTKCAARTDDDDDSELSDELTLIGADVRLLTYGDEPFATAPADVMRLAGRLLRALQKEDIGTSDSGFVFSVLLQVLADKKAA
jgi:hypothetical protein